MNPLRQLWRLHLAQKLGTVLRLRIRDALRLVPQQRQHSDHREARQTQRSLAVEASHQLPRVAPAQPRRRHKRRAMVTPPYHQPDGCGLRRQRQLQHDPVLVHISSNQRQSLQPHRLQELQQPAPRQQTRSRSGQMLLQQQPSSAPWPLTGAGARAVAGRPATAPAPRRGRSPRSGRRPPPRPFAAQPGRLPAWGPRRQQSGRCRCRW